MAPIEITTELVVMVMLQDVIHRKFPRVTRGKELCYLSHGLLMGKTYVTPWVTHGIELRAFIARKMPKRRHNV